MLLTVGHSNHSSDELIRILRMHHVTAIADVRSTPYSRFAPHFSREHLRFTLARAGITYVFLGKELGARPQNPACYQGGRVQYSLLAKERAFVEGATRIATGMQRFQVALMCAEKDPMDCHRALLVARHFADNGVEVAHIRFDGSLEPHESFEERLLSVCNLPAGDMFKSRDEYLDQAYALRGDRVAYLDEEMLQSKGECE